MNKKTKILMGLNEEYRKNCKGALDGWRDTINFMEESRKIFRWQILSFSLISMAIGITISKIFSQTILNILHWVFILTSLAISIGLIRRLRWKN